MQSAALNVRHLMKRFARRRLAWPLIAVFLGIGTLTAPAALPFFGRGLPMDDLDFLRAMTCDVVEASRVKPNSNGGGRWPLTNSCGFALITPGKDTYTAFWVRDFSMSVDSGFITAEELRHHLLLICEAQNGPADLQLANGLHVPAWAFPITLTTTAAQPTIPAPAPRARIRAPELAAASRQSTTITNSSISLTPAGR